MLILDLDDTIFETQSIGKEHVAPIFDKFRNAALDYFRQDEVEIIMSDLWKFPFDYVSNRYNFNDLLNREFLNSVNKLEYELDITPFNDFKYIRSILNKKYLVTTGFKKLQMAKIRALDIEKEFDSVYIDNVTDPIRKYKKEIFEEILKLNNTQAQNVYVIGDNPNSELKAGHELGMVTIQVAKFNQTKCSFVDYRITDFRELVQIINEKEYNS